jgi:host factor-I protein
MEKQSVLEDFLGNLRKSKKQVYVFLINGIKLQGQIGHFDNYVITLKTNSFLQIIYRHSIATIAIVPSANYLRGGH